jgi:hypothetical protein
MSTSNRFNRAPDGMTIRELAQLRLLNDRLAEAERWIREQIATCANTAGNAALQTHLYCHSRTQRLVFKSGCDSILAMPDDGRCAKPYANAAPLADMLMCTFFVALHRHLGYDWSALLDVDRVRAHICIALCRDFHVWS